MPIQYKRGDGLDLYVKGASGPVIIPRSDVHKRLGVKSIIRIAKSEYPEDTLSNSRLVHFNLPSYGEKEGDITALARILENGHYVSGVSESQPLLSLEDIWIARLVRTIEMIPYGEIAPEFFLHTIGDIRNVEELKERILERYHPSLPALSDQQILAQGVSIREVELLKKDSYSSVRGEQVGSA